MKAYCKNGYVVATHTDEQNVAADAYGEGITIINVPNDYNFEREGPPPPEGEFDHRPILAPAQTIDEIKADAQVRVTAYANAVADRLLVGVPRAEMLSYGSKEIAARAQLAGETLTETQTALLLAEASVTGQEIDDLCRRIIAKAEIFAKAAGLIAGFRNSVSAAISAANSAKQVASILAKGAKDVETAYTGLLAGK